ncbi:MAG: hypothetical protein ABJA57_05145 [Ginsengibacter sp.]
MKKFLFIILAAMATFSMESCSKSNDKSVPVPVVTTQQKIQARWTLENYIYHEHGTNPVYDTTTVYTGTSSDYLDFKANGKVYYSLSEYSDSSTYSVIGDTTLFISQLGNYKILSLTDHALKLNFREDDAAIAGYFEETYNLNK